MYVRVYIHMYACETLCSNKAITKLSSVCMYNVHTYIYTIYLLIIDVTLFTVPNRFCE